MFPLVIVAFAGIGVTRLALLALELHGQTGQQEEGEPGHEDNREAAIEEMRRLEKPAKLVLKNDCQYVCIWRAEDLQEDLSLEEMLEGARGKDAETESVFQAFQDFCDHVMTGKPGPTENLPRIGRGRPRLGVNNNHHNRHAPRDNEGMWGGRGEGQGRGGGGGGGGNNGNSREQDAKAQPGRSCSYQGGGADNMGGLTAKDNMPRGGTGNTEDMCLVCYDNPVDAVLLTCGHGSLCFSCAIDVYRSTSECPLCRSRVEQVVTVGTRSRLRSGVEVVTVTGP